MTERDATKGAPPAEMTDTAAEPTRKALGRRLLVLRIATAGGAIAAAAPAAEALEPTLAQYRTGLTDSDPNDSPGYGRGYRGSPRTGLTDSDPNDGAGQGRGYRGAPRTGITDADPNDGAGNGRGGSRGRSVSDNDPNDPPGRGRGWR